jgi:hypothetical protein
MKIGSILSAAISLLVVATPALSADCDPKALPREYIDLYGEHLSYDLLNKTTNVNVRYDIVGDSAGLTLSTFDRRLIRGSLFG